MPKIIWNIRATKMNPVPFLHIYVCVLGNVHVRIRMQNDTCILATGDSTASSWNTSSRYLATSQPSSSLPFFLVYRHVNTHTY